MKSKLYLITTDFPYGHGENSFLLPELPYLTQRFDVTIISHSLSMEQTAELGAEIRVVHYNRKASVLQKLWDSVCFFACRDACVELWDIIRSGKKIGKRLFESLLFLRKQGDSGVFSKNSRSLMSQGRQLFIAIGLLTTVLLWHSCMAKILILSWLREHTDTICTMTVIWGKDSRLRDRWIKSLTVSFLLRSMEDGIIWKSMRLMIIINIVYFI